jgi:hypothetical protein
MKRRNSWNKLRIKGLTFPELEGRKTSWEYEHIIVSLMSSPVWTPIQPLLQYPLLAIPCPVWSYVWSWLNWDKTRNENTKLGLVFENSTCLSSITEIRHNRLALVCWGTCMDQHFDGVHNKKQTAYIMWWAPLSSPRLVIGVFPLTLSPDNWFTIYYS